jgi:dihydroorotase
VGSTGLPLMVHPHDQDLMDEIEGRYWKREDRSPQAYAKAYRDYDGIIWDTAMATLFRMQKALGARLHILHMTTPEGIAMLRRAKDEGRPCSCEVNPWAMFLGTWENVEKMGPYCLGFWVPPAHVNGLWEAINDGTIDMIGTDHAPHTKEEKDRGWADMWSCPGGEPQIQDYLSLFLDAVNEGKLSLDRLVRISSYNPAKVFNIYPKKRRAAAGLGCRYSNRRHEQRRSNRQRDDLHQSRLDAVQRPQGQRRADPHNPARQDGDARRQDRRQARGRTVGEAAG